MSVKAGFAEIDITPPLGTKKIGWMADLPAETILDPLYSRVAIFDDGKKRIAFVQLDTLSIRWTQVNQLRREIEEKYGFPGANVMVSATHNHAGPAIAGVAPVPRDNKYAADTIMKCGAAFGDALASLQEAEIGYGTGFNFEVAHNRRAMTRDGKTKCQIQAKHDPGFLCLEGPRDGQLAVIAVRSAATGAVIGSLVNYACHATHNGGDKTISAGFPGVVCAKMKESGCPVTLYLNGAYGNVIHANFETCEYLSAEEAADSVFQTIREVIDSIDYSVNWDFDSRLEKVELSFREITDDEYHGRVFGAQRFNSDALYEAAIDRYVARVKRGEKQPADVQVHRLGDVYLVGIPAEYFVEYQLRIKEKTYPRRALVVGGANGMIGYVPTKEAFTRGGYETTLGPPSKMAPETGDILCAKAIDLIKGF